MIPHSRNEPWSGFFVDRQSVFAGAETRDWGFLPSLGSHRAAASLSRWANAV